MQIVRLVILSALLVGLSDTAYPQAVPPKGALLYIISPADGATIKGAFWCRFGLRNMGVTHAGDDFPNSGHHHLLIDVDEPLNPDEPIPHDKKHLHFGAGQTEALLDLPPGKHTLQLVLGDGKHQLFNPPLVSKKITITIKKSENRTPEKPNPTPKTTRDQGAVFSARASSGERHRDFAKMLAACHIGEGLRRLFEGENLINYGLQPMEGDRIDHHLEIFERADRDPLEP